MQFMLLQFKLMLFSFPKKRSVFRPCGESSRYVRWCLEQLATHNTEHWTRIIAAFHQALALQAHDVIKAFQLKPHP
jgi:hypothetical protein